MVSYDGSGTGMHGTTLQSTLMESCMDITSGMIVMVMCSGKGTSYYLTIRSRVPPLPPPPGSVGYFRPAGLLAWPLRLHARWHVCCNAVCCWILF